MILASFLQVLVDEALD